MLSAQDSIFRVSVGGRREADIVLVHDPGARGTKVLGGLLECLLGSMFLLLPSGSEENAVQMLEGRFSAEPDGFCRFGGIE
jgi:hypothetical protein